MKQSRLHRWLAVVVGLAALFFALATAALTNDHFGRISPAWQIARYGELPFRDFLDPGYFLTEFVSAALLGIFDGTLLGEWLLTSSFIAGGTVVVLLLAFQVSRSYPIALTAAAVSLLSLPRTYDYDKVLFYPLGLLLCFRYTDRRDARTIWVLAAGLVLAALFRYDTGMYVGGAALTVIGITHAGDWSSVLGRAGLLMFAAVLLSLPALGFLYYRGGLPNAADQIVAYGQRETERTRISRPLRFSIGRLVGFATADATSTRILVRWAAAVNEPTRSALESRYRLRDATVGGAATRAWSYRIDDPSPRNLRALADDPHVEDTDGIDRERFVLSETFLTRLGRKIPILPDARTIDNANAFLYHLLRWLPLLASVILLKGAVSGAPWSRADVARIASLIVTCVLLNIFILRDPVDARVGGMAGPAAVLSAWMARQLWGIRTRAVRYAATAGSVAVVWLTLWSLSTAMEWERRINIETLSPASVRRLAAAFAEAPASLQAYPNRDLVIGMVSYLRECTSVNDRVFGAWFVPELYYFAQRGFVGSVATFDQHWSEPRFQERIINAFVSHSVPVVLTETSRHAEFVENYSLLGLYLDEHFRVAGTTDFGNPGGNYTVLVDKNRNPARTHPATGMPCF